MPIKIKGLTPLVQVFDMPRSISFYRDTLGFEVVHTSSPGDDCDWAMLRKDGSELMLNTRYERDSRPEAPDTARIEAHDDTCLYIGCPDVDGAYEYLLSMGIDAKPPTIAFYGMKQLYIHDPDGFSLCFQWPVKNAGK